VVPLVARVVYRDWPFEEAYFEPAARRFLGRVRTPLMLLGGVNRLATIERALAEGFEFVALARALIRRPDLVRAFAEGRADESGCTHCNLCLVTMSQGPTRCPLRDEPVARVAAGVGG
jgi:2,4-dienoyl-CoA reductase-like NADH-dependent reductase (Old Yellow Enzyme family)